MEGSRSGPMRLQVATMPTVVFLAWRIVINHAVLSKILAWWSASCLLLSRSICSASGLLLSCFIMRRFRLLLSLVRFMFTTCHVRILSTKSLRYYCLSFIITYLFFFLPVHYCFIFLFDTAILREQGSLLFTTCVFLYTKQNDPCHG